MSNKIRIKKYGKSRTRKVLEFLFPFPFDMPKSKEKATLIIWDDILGRKPTKEEKQKILEWFNELDETKFRKIRIEEKEMYGNYVVISQWDNGRLLAQIVTAGDREAAVRGKQRHLDATSKQSNNRVVAVSERPIHAIPSGVFSEDQRWASVPLVQVVQEEVAPPPPPKVTKVKSTYATAFSLGGAGARLMEAGSSRRSPQSDVYSRSSYDLDESY